ncbi:hypothetical protein MMC18_005363 [Xylographa bjoerkii]|nr:hypothetical protein [Xylographa bjoerkii]
MFSRYLPLNIGQSLGGYRRPPPSIKGSLGASFAKALLVLPAHARLEAPSIWLTICCGLHLPSHVPSNSAYGYSEEDEAVFDSTCAGVKDSALTIHGSLQAGRLGRHLAQSGVKATHVFASDLQRAYKTAEAICATQTPENDGNKNRLEVMKLAILREQDFGFYEGKPFYARSRDSNKSGKDSHRLQHAREPGFQDVETKEAMAIRMESFVDLHILPLLPGSHSGTDPVIIVVSHGIILSTLWRCILGQFPNQSVRLGPGLAIRGGGPTTLEHLGGWSNTGYLELDINALTSITKTTTADPAETSAAARKPGPNTPAPRLLDGYIMTIKAVNSKDHLVGLKRTGGGVGSSKFDEGQKTIESFLKKRKV